MSKRQRRRLQERRSLHEQRARPQRIIGAKLPVTLAIAAAPVIAPVAAEAAGPGGDGTTGAPAPAVGAPAPSAPAALAGSPISAATQTPIGQAPAAAAPAQAAPSNPDAPPMTPNPAPNNGGTGGISAGASYYDGIGGGATLVATPQGAYIVPEFGIGFGPSVSVNAGSNVNVPNAPQLQFGGSYADQVGPVGLRGSATITEPLNDLGDPNAINVGGNLGANLPGIPAGNLRASGNYSPAAGPTGGVQYSVTNQLFNVTDQVKLAVRVPIPLPNPSQTLAPDANGVSDVITQTGGEGPPAMTASRDVSAMGYPDGNGNTVTVNPDGSYTVHTPTSDVTTFGPFYAQQQGLPDNSNGGTLTHQLIDNLGQRTDQLVFQGNNGIAVTQDSSGNLTQTNPDGSVIKQTAAGVVTQTDPDGSSVSYDPSTGDITTSDGHLFGTTTTFNSNGSVSQMSPAGSTIWDSSGNSQSFSSFDGIGLPVPSSEAKPTAPYAPPSISLPHDPNAPASGSSNAAPAPADAGNAPADSGTPVDAATPAPADSGSTPAPADSGSAPPPADSGSAPAPTDSGSAPPPADSGSAPPPAATGSAPPPADSGSAPAPTDSGSAPPPADSGSAPPPADSGSAPASTDSGSAPAPADSAPAPADSASTPPPVDSAPMPPVRHGSAACGDAPAGRHGTGARAGGHDAASGGRDTGSSAGGHDPPR